MPLTTVTSPALIVVDLQEGIVTLPTVHPAAHVVDRAASLAATFREQSWPVVLVNVASAAPGRSEIMRRAGEVSATWTDLVPALGATDGDILVTKNRWSAFADTGLDEKLRALGVTQVVIVGIATTMGVESTARSAHERGYDVVIVTDAITDTDADAHANSVSKIFPRLAEMTTTATLLALVRTSATANA